MRSLSFWFTIQLQKAKTVLDLPYSMLNQISTVWKVSKYGVFSGPNFLVFELNIEIYLVNIRIQSKYKKYGVEQTPFLDTLHAVWPVGSCNCWINRISGNDRSKRKYNFLVITTFLVSIAVTDSHAFERFWEKKETEKKKNRLWLSIGHNLTVE